MLAALGGIGGALVSGFMAKSAAKDQAQLQEKFAKNAIQWKVQDAIAAGVHPLAALGAQTTSYSPVSVGTPDLTSAGQDLGRAIKATTDVSGRAVQNLTLEKAALENEYLRAQIASVRTRTAASQVPPAVAANNEMLVPGQGDTAAPIMQTLKNPERTRAIATPAGVIVTAPGTSDAQMWQDRYGDILEEVGGLWNFGADALHTYRRNYPVRPFTPPAFRNRAYYR